MANHKSAVKSARQITARTTIRTARHNRVRTFIKKVETAILAGDQPAANAALRELQPEFFAGVNKGIYKKETASRKISRLNSRIKAIAA